MGMTDRQFDAYNKNLLGWYKKIEKEIVQLTGDKNKKSETLEELIKNTEENLQRP